jgi:ATP-binding cassette subfamily C protein
MAVPQKELSAALNTLRGTAWSLVMMSAMLNIIYLTGSFFMLEVYDRVIPSKSLPTLIGLGVIVARPIHWSSCPRPDTQPNLQSSG